MIREVTEVEMDDDESALYIPKHGVKYLTKDRTEELFLKLLIDGYADLSEFSHEKCKLEVLL